jgi:hypothetical protein
MIPRRLSVEYISFSAHVDGPQNTEYIEAVGARHVVSTSVLTVIRVTFKCHNVRFSCMANKLPWVVYAVHYKPDTRIETKTSRFIHPKI